jgi:N-carbamoyl-L-amino-acid hydrolase
MATSPAAAVARHVSRERLLGLIDALAQFGARPGGGVDRQALGSADIAAHAFLARHARSLDCEPRRDAAGNLFFRRRGATDGPPVASGSHIDTQPAGGRLDGAFGVCAALEVLAALDDAGQATRLPVEVTVWSNEEGCRFAPGSLGSQAFAEPASLATLIAARDAAGTTYAECVEQMNAALADVPASPLGHEFSAFVEAHIEQGPVLEQCGTAIGVVTAVQGVRWFRVTATGAAAHAGTTPLAHRRDALRAIAPLLDLLYASAETHPDLRVTVGKLSLWPDSINTIPGQATAAVDVRHVDGAILDHVESMIRRYCADAHFGCTLECERLMALPTPPFDAAVAGTLRRAAGSLGLSSRDMVSGAFHDAVHAARLCPTAMLFVPSRDGLSHNPAEHTDPDQLVAGARVLAHALTELAGSVPS